MQNKPYIKYKFQLDMENETTMPHTPPIQESSSLSEKIEDYINDVTYDEITVASAVELISQLIIKEKIKLLDNILIELKTKDTTIGYMVEATEYEMHQLQNKLKIL